MSIMSTEFLTELTATTNALLATGKVVTREQAITATAEKLKEDISSLTKAEVASIFNLAVALAGLPFTLVKGPYGGVKPADWAAKTKTKKVKKVEATEPTSE